MRISRRFLTALMCWMLAASVALAQDGPPADWNQVVTRIETDGSLGSAPPQTISPDNFNIYTIGEEVGFRPGGGLNLFHSFSNFDLGAGDTARFTASQFTQNVVSRVTGGAASNLNGTLQSLVPGADFYFLNPIGVFFGPDARLDVPAAFYTSTADRLGFDNGESFFTEPGSDDPLLSMGTPDSFGFFGTAPIGRIGVDESVLEVARGERIAFVGGDIDIVGGQPGIIQAPVGSIALLSVASAGEVRFDANDATKPILVGEFAELGELSLRELAFLSTRDRGSGLAGDVSLTAGRVTLDSSFIDTRAAEIAGRESITVANTRVEATTDNSLAPVSIGLAAPQISLFGSAGRLIASSDNAGDAGTIELRAERIEISDGFTLLGITSGLDTQTLGLPAGRGADILLEASESVLIDRARVFANTLGDGDAGDITVRGPAGERPEIRILGSQVSTTVVLLNPSDAPDGTNGSAGNINLVGRSLTLGPSSDGLLETSVSAATGSAMNRGAGGNIRIDIVPSDDHEPGEAAINILAGAGLEAEVFGSGAGGAIWVNSPDARMRVAGTINASTFGIADAADIRIDVAHLEIRDGGFIAAVTTDDGAGGSIDIHTESLLVKDGARITTEASGIGAAGAIHIESKLLTVDDASINSSSSTALTERVLFNGEQETGFAFFDQEHLLSVAAADVEEQLRAVGLTLGPDPLPEDIVRFARILFQLSDDATIEDVREARYPGTTVLDGGTESIAFLRTAIGQAGNIEIDVGDLVLANGGNIQSSTTDGPGGQVSVAASNSVGLFGQSATGTVIDTNGGEPIEFASFIRTATDGIGNAGTTDITTPSLLLDDAAVITAEAQGLGDAGNVSVRARQLTLRGASEIRSTSAATAESLSKFYAEELAFRPEFESFLTQPGGAGSVFVESDVVRLSGHSQISVFAESGAVIPEGLRPGEPSAGLADGNIAIEVRDVLLLEGGSTIEASVATGLGGSITIGGEVVELPSPSDPNRSLFEPTQPTEGIVLRDGSSILAQARPAEASEKSDANGLGATAEPLSARGGDIRINARSALLCPDCEINADGPTTNSGGSVVLNNPATAIDSQVIPSQVSYVDASSLLLAQCRSRSEGEATQSGRFTLARWSSAAESRDDPFFALSSFDEGLLGRPSLATGAALRGKGDPQEDAATESYRSAMRSGDTLLRGGRHESAAAAFAEARAAARRSDGREAGSEVDALLGLAEARQGAGAFRESLPPLLSALALARASEDERAEATTLGALGKAHGELGENASAESYLQEAVEVSRGLVLHNARDSATTDLASPLAGSLLGELGNQRARGGNAAGAMAAYLESAQAARDSGAWLAVARGQANAARAAVSMADADSARTALREAGEALERSDASPAERIAVHLHLAYTTASIAKDDPAALRVEFLAAHANLERAREIAESVGNIRATSRALGQLGALYAQEGGRERESHYLTLRALKLAQQKPAPDLLARWYTQLGGIDWRAGRVDQALDAYRRAVRLLQETRPEAAADYSNADLAFRQAVEPVYLALVDVLLTTSRQNQSPSLRQRHLREARQVIEQLKAAELRNHFRDSCAAELAATARPLESVDPHAAVIYPIALPDRLELLVSTSSGIAQHTVPISRVKLRDETERFRRSLTNPMSYRYRTSAQQLYALLVAPYVDDLADEGIDTLVFVPGRMLRTVPLSALHDGESFLIERYAVAITPSLDLLAPKPLVPRKTQFLLAGLSDEVQGYPALPGVESELEAIESLYGGEVLLNESFDAGALAAALRNQRPGVVHIASHAEFNGDRDTSFVLTHDGRLSMEELATLVRTARYGEEPVELLMLSACETAVGDERAALGLAGVAIRAGARSAMGSLWKVSDEATRQLVVGFYQGLDTPGMSKAKALQHSQQQLMSDRRFMHPFYWAPFLIINNWL